MPEGARARIYQIARIGNPALPEVPDAATRQHTLDTFLRSSPAYANLVVRTRHTEDALHRAVANGLRQYLILGAGFDSYALRRPPGAGELTVIEVDHPATQAFKLMCMDAAAMVVPDGVHHTSPRIWPPRTCPVCWQPRRCGAPNPFSFPGWGSRCT